MKTLTESVLHYAFIVTALAIALSAGTASAEGKLSIYHWFEYIPQELLDKFAAEYNVEVSMDTYDSKIFEKWLAH